MLEQPGAAKLQLVEFPWTGLESDFEEELRARVHRDSVMKASSGTLYGVLYSFFIKRCNFAKARLLSMSTHGSAGDVPIHASIHMSRRMSMQHVRTRKGGGVDVREGAAIADRGRRREADAARILRGVPRRHLCAPPAREEVARGRHRRRVACGHGASAHDRRVGVAEAPDQRRLQGAAAAPA